MKHLRKGPVIVKVDKSSWRSYSVGVWNSCTSKVNKYSLLVGSNIGEWKLRQSWSDKWGSLGYMRIGSKNTCGVCMEGTVPILDRDLIIKS